MFRDVDACQKPRLPSNVIEIRFQSEVLNLALALIRAALYALQRGSHAALSGYLASLKTPYRAASRAQRQNRDGNH